MDTQAICMHVTALQQSIKPSGNYFKRAKYHMSSKLKKNKKKKQVRFSMIKQDEMFKK